METPPKVIFESTWNKNGLYVKQNDKYVDICYQAEDVQLWLPEGVKVKHVDGRLEISANQ